MNKEIFLRVSDNLTRSVLVKDKEGFKKTIPAKNEKKPEHDPILLNEGVCYYDDFFKNFCYIAFSHIEYAI